MKQSLIRLFSGAITVCLLAGVTTQAADLVFAKDGSGVYGYKDTPRLPWCGYVVHDPDRPAPPKLDPGADPGPAARPADAVVLFAEGGEMSAWEPGGWKVEDGQLVAGEGALRSKAEFGDMQLHVEYQGPADFEGPWYNQGNNGVMLMGQYEIQIFDSWNEKLYPDGQCAAIYGQTPPRVNVTRPPGQWQSFDILFKAPVFDGDKLVAPARVTMLHNGVLVHWEEEVHGGTGHRILPKYEPGLSTGPVVLGGHGCPVRFRNIWARRL